MTVGSGWSSANASSGAIKIPVPVNEALNALFDRCPGLKADISHKCFYICKGTRYVSRLKRKHVLQRLLAYCRLDAFDEIQQFHRLSVADVIETVGRSRRSRVRLCTIPVWVRRRDLVERPYNGLNNIIDEGKITRVLSEIEDIDRLTGDDLFCKQKERHVRPSPGTIDGEEAQARDRQFIQMGIRMSHQLVGLLAGGIEVQRMIDVVVDAVWHPGVGSVNRAGRSINQMLDPVMTAALQDMHEADQE